MFYNAYGWVWVWLSCCTHTEKRVLEPTWLRIVKAVGGHCPLQRFLFFVFKQMKECIQKGNCMYFAEAILVGGVGLRRLQRVGCCVTPRVGFSRRRLLHKS